MNMVEKHFMALGLSTKKKPKYILLKYAQVVEEVEKVAKDAADIIGFSVENTKILLHHFKWDAMNMTEKFYEADSPKAFLQKNNITLIDEANHDEMIAIDKCLECEEVKEVVLLESAHPICVECWKEYPKFYKKMAEKETNNFLATYDANNSKRFVLSLKCPTPQCNFAIPETFAVQLFNDPVTAEYYEDILVNSFVALQPDYKRCPNWKNGCENVVKIESLINAEEITCDCGFTFCFSCDDVPHSPFPCEFLRVFKTLLANIKDDISHVNISCWHCKRREKFSLQSPNECKHCGNETPAGLSILLQTRFVPLLPIMKKYSKQEELLLVEYKQLHDLDDNHGNVDFIKTTFKLIHDFRQKLLNFYIFSHFLETSQNAYFGFALNLESFEALLEKATSLFNYGEKSSDAEFTEEKQNEIINALMLLQARHDALLKCYHEEKWTFNGYLKTY